MKEIVVISGKGGTGKTSLTAAFVNLAAHPVMADCDVDASDLHLIMRPNVKQTTEFFSGNEAVINQDKCINCGACLAHCRFEAVTMLSAEGPFKIKPSGCEGCGVCVRFCPVEAIDFPERRCGTWSISDTRFGALVHARLDAGAENSGKLVSLVRSEARKAAQSERAEVVLIDGPPGIGCPVIASVTGCDAVVAVTEPTLSGQHDLGRVLELARHFEVPVHVIVNKWDINAEVTEKIEAQTARSGQQVLGRIPFNRAFTGAQIEASTVLEFRPGNRELEHSIKKAWQKLWATL